MPNRPTDERTRSRASALLPEEQSAGVEDPELQAQAILAESDARQMERSATPDTFLEKRRSSDTL